MQKGRSTEINWDSLNAIADWVVELEQVSHGESNILIQSAIEAGKRYLTEPTQQNQSQVDILAGQLAKMEQDYPQPRFPNK